MSTNTCPRCQNVALVEVVLGNKTCLTCPKCRGRAYTIAVLCTLVQSRHVLALKAKAETKAQEGPRRCPICRRAMKLLVEPNKSGTYELDVCVPCAQIWFDAGEFEQAPSHSSTPRVLNAEDQAEANRVRALKGRRLLRTTNSRGSLWLAIFDLFNT